MTDDKETNMFLFSYVWLVKNTYSGLLLVLCYYALETVVFVSVRVCVDVGQILCVILLFRNHVINVDIFCL